jgi:phycoerythrin-associated linker protein
MVSTAPAVKFGIDAFSGSPVELWATSSAEEVQAVIRAVYRQVLGNAHVMDSERLVSLESQLCDRSISVREFVRGVAKSANYRARFFESAAPYRFVELNFKHLLGRAPADQAEISEHIQRCINEGYDGEIDSYIDSTEYQSAFGDSVVPYYRGIQSQVGQKQVAYNRMFSVFRGPAESDSAVKASQLVYAVGTNSPSEIKAAKSVPTTEKKFKIVVKGSKFDCNRRRRSTSEYIVSGRKMTPQIQRIHRSSGTIVSITEI